MIERSLVGMPIRNQNSYSIFGKYPLASRITLDMNDIIEKEFSIVNSIDEFAYLVLYVNLLLSLDSYHTKKIKILLVCFNGRPETITIINDLNSQITKFNNVEIDLHDYYSLENIDLKDYSLLISTIPIKNDSIFSVVLNEKESYYSQVIKAINLYHLQQIQIENVFRKEYFVKDFNAKDKNEVIELLYTLFPNINVSFDWMGENKTTVETDKRVIYLNPMNQLSNDFVLIIILKKPIIWERQWIQILVWVNCNSINNRYVYYDILDELFGDAEKVNQFINIKNYGEYIDKIKSFAEGGK